MSDNDDKIKIELGPDDCAIIFRDDGKSFLTEMQIPQSKDGMDLVSTPVALCVAIGTRIHHDPNFMQEQLEWIADQSKKAKA